MERAVIIGGGQAGFSVASQLREQGFDGAIDILSAEPVLPYQRPPLSKAYLSGDMALERLFLRPENYFAEQSISLHLGAIVEHIDRDGQHVSWADGTLKFNHLVFATGAAPICLPDSIGGRLDGVFSIRQLTDIDALKAKLPTIKRLIVIGGGYIGLEAAAVAAKMGIEVTLFEAADRILQRVACAETAAFFRDLHTSRGVKIVEDAKVAELTGQSGRVNAVRLVEGTQSEADAVIVGIGVRPSTALAEDLGLCINNGIAVDEFGQSDSPGIWAVGDCASFPINGQRVRVESVPNAIDMAAAVASNILGRREPYSAKPWFWSDQFNVKLQIAGLNTGYDRVVVRADGSKLSHWYFKRGELLAVDAINDARSFLMGRQLIERGIPLTPEQVADTSLNLKSLLS